MLHSPCTSTRASPLLANPAQAAIAPRPAGPDCPPCGGDGFTYEHLADRDEVRPAAGAWHAWHSRLGFICRLRRRCVAWMLLARGLPINYLCHGSSPCWRERQASTTPAGVVGLCGGHGGRRRPHLCVSGWPCGGGRLGREAGLMSCVSLCRQAVQGLRGHAACEGATPLDPSGHAHPPLPAASRAAWQRPSCV